MPTSAKRAPRDGDVSRKSTASAAAGEEEEEEPVNMRAFIRQYLAKFFVDHIPMEGLSELPTIYMVIFGTIAYVAAIAIFIYFTYSSYHDSMSQAFISLDDSSGTCDSVPIAITGRFLADKKGNWEGTPDFLYAFAPYNLVLSRFEVSSFAQYQQMMRVFREALLLVGAIATQQNLALNLVLWTNFQRYYSLKNPATNNFSDVGFGQLQYVEMTGDSTAVFDLQYQFTTVGNAQGFCDEPSLTIFDRSNGILAINYNYTEYIASPACLRAANPSSLGYVSSFNDQQFSLQIDVRSLTTALAVNLGFSDLHNLGVSGTQSREFVVLNTSFLLGQYFDLRYSAMAPIYCVSNTSEIRSDLKSAMFRRLCFYNFGATIAIPLFNHYGKSNAEPEYCSCDSEDRLDVVCNEFTLMSALLFFPIPPSASISAAILAQVRSMIMLVSRFETFRELNYAAFNASWAGASQAYRAQSNVTRSPTWQRRQFDFCQISSTQACSLLVVNSFDAVDRTVSEFKYQLNNASCSDSFNIPDEYWEKLVSTPPAQLTQNYFECYPTESAALLNAVGVATGNTSLAVPFVVFVCLPFIYIVLVLIHQVPPPEEYSKEEKQQAMETLATLLLRTRDGKTRGIKVHGALSNLTKEIISAAKEEAGFPDSDDEDDDDEDEEEDGRPRSKGNQTRRVSRRRSSVRRRRASRVVDSDDEEGAEEDDHNLEEGENEADSNVDSDEDAEYVRQKSSKQGAVKKLIKKATRRKMAVFTKNFDTDESANAKFSLPKFDLSVLKRHSMRRSTLTKSGLIELRSRRSGVASNPMLFLDLTKNAPPADVVVLNMPKEDKWSKKQQRLDCNEVVDELSQLWTTTMSLPSEKKEEACRAAARAAEQLVYVDLMELCESQDMSVLFKLFNALCMHGSEHMNCSLNQVESVHGEKLAYNIGGRMVTVALLAQLLS